MSAQLNHSRLPVLSEEHSDLLLRLTTGLDTAALNWVSGYAAGLAARAGAAQGPIAVPLDAPKAATDSRLTVVYGSQTGNAKREAERVYEAIRAAGAHARIVRADAYPLRELVNERAMLIVISTQGEGDPPDDARGLVEYLQSRRAPRLPSLQYSVLGLGDSSYVQFNAVARQLDTRLQDLGAQRLLPLAQADIDIDTVAAPWRVQVLEKAEALTSRTTNERSAAAVVAPAKVDSATAEQPFAAELLANQRITGRDSDQDVRHLELALTGSGIAYEPGDALGIRANNAAPLVERVLEAARLSGSESVRIGDEIRSLHDWLTGHRELTRLHPGFLRRHAERTQSTTLDTLLAPDSHGLLSEWMSSRQLDDVLREFPLQWGAGELVAALRPLAPRLYSIASSRKAVGEEAHLAVAVLEQQRDQTRQFGVASGFLAASRDGVSVPVYLHSNERFRLPPDAGRDVIMIGPGTGVAPFRGFVQERTAVAAGGRNWLFFGARHGHSQFLYQLEWQAALRDGQLQRLDLAFSRDQAERIHVSQRLREQGREVYTWLQGGAHLYVCGAIAMGRSVHEALREVVTTHGGRSRDDADAYLNELQQAGRYARDVY